MIGARFDDSFNGWRQVARSLVTNGVQPEEVEWIAGTTQESLFAAEAASAKQRASFSVPSDFVRLAESVACFRDPARWPLLYRVLWRLTHGERSLLSIVVDKDVHRMQRMASAVRRDEHKMKAFVRFKRVGDEKEENARYIAWFTPAHLILERVAPFFSHRFASMCWSILTPDGSIHWNREQLAFGPAVDRSSAPATDELETLWRTYYSSVFNPARLKLSAMRSEMPKKYWSGLPEARLIPDLVANAPRRVREMRVSELSGRRELEHPAPGGVSDT
jgi:probable DNA metabolism protein